MRGLVLMFVLVAGCGDLTQVLVSVDAVGLTVPTQVAKLRITAGTGTDAEYKSQDLPLCAPGQSASCYSLPLTTTLVPGHTHPDDPVRVQVDALDAGGNTVTSDAATFEFASGQKQRLDFFLSPSCLDTSCSSQDLSCREGTCVATTASSLAGEPPDMASVPVGPIERTSFVNGAVLKSASAASVPRPTTQPGDIVLLALSSSDGQQPAPGAASDWKALGTLQSYSSSALYGHVATSGDDAAYVYATATTAYIDFALATYRGARTFQAGTNQDADVCDFTLFSGPVSAGSIVVGLLFDGGEDGFTFSSAAKDVVRQGSDLLFDEGPFGAGSTPEDTFQCKPGEDSSGGGSLFEVFLSP